MKPAPPAFVDELSPSNHQVVFFINIYASLSAVRTPHAAAFGKHATKDPGPPTTSGLDEP